MKSPSPDTVGKVTRLPVKDFLSFVQQNHCLAKLGFIQVSGAPYDPNPTGNQFLNNLPKITPGDWVDAYPRLIQQYKLRLADQGATKPKLLFHPAEQHTHFSTLKSFQVGTDR